MAQRLEQQAGLTNIQLDHIRRLEQACNAFEGLTMKLNWGRLRRRPTGQVNDFLFFEEDELAGFLGLYSFSPTEAEVSAMTHPDYRRRGIFGRLLSAARQELKQRNIPDFLFICEQASRSGLSTMKSIGAGYEFTEHKMVLAQPVKPSTNPQFEMRPAGPEDLAEMVRLDELCFGISGEVTRRHLEEGLVDLGRLLLIAATEDRTIGKIQVTRIGSEAYISGFCVYPAFRGQGYGTAILTITVERLVAGGHHNITLEVATDNRRALALYERCGFRVITAYDYYRLPVNH